MSNLLQAATIQAELAEPKPVRELLLRILCTVIFLCLVMEISLEGTRYPKFVTRIFFRYEEILLEIISDGYAHPKIFPYEIFLYEN